MNTEYEELEYQNIKVEYMFETMKIRDVIAMQAPTGAGKTVIMAYFLDKFLDINPQKYAYIWASPRAELPKQSMKKIERFFKDTEKIMTVHRNEIQDRIKADQIWFVNWEYVNSLLGKDGESVHSLESIIHNTREKGLKIMLIIDESHWGAESEHATKTKASINVISPDKKIHMTATPKGDVRDDEPITHDQVRDAGMITSKTWQNRDMKNEDIQLDDKLIEEGIKRRNKLVAKYEKYKIQINPLLLIQVPNSKSGDESITKAKAILEENGISVKKGNLMIWTAEHHVRENDLTENTSKINALIFKQAISLGWDCPRAAILVGLRNLNADTFGIQTLGRIIRTPEGRHYKEDPELNESYLYSGSNILEVMKENGMMPDTKQLHIKDDVYSTLNLPRGYFKNIGITNLGDDFKDIFLKYALEKTHNNNNMAQAMRHNVTYATTNVPVDRGIDTEREYQEHNLNDGSATYRSNMKDVETCLKSIVKDVIIQENVGFSNDSSAITGFLIEILHEVFAESGYDTNCECNVQCNHYNDFKILNMIVNDDDNKELFKTRLKTTITEFAKKRHDRVDQKPTTWNIVKRQIVNVEQDMKPDGKIHPWLAKDYTEQFDKYVMNPALVKMASMIEINFSREINCSENVKWWYKNDTTSSSFGIPYPVDDYKYSTFMPDFIVKMNDGRIGIFDTKDGDTLESAGARANALADYITENKNLRLFGGIITWANDKWKIHDKNPYSSNMSDNGWSDLRL